MWSIFVNTARLLFISHLLKSLVSAQNTNNSSSILLQGGTIISFSRVTSSLEILRNSSILISGDRIVGVGGSAPLSAVPPDTEIVNLTPSHIIAPGFIDTHRHGWQTAFRTIGSNTSITQSLARYGQEASAGRLSPEDVYTGQLTGLYEALNAGVTTTLDFSHHTWSPEHSAAGLNASVDSGARVFWTYAIQNLPDTFPVQDQRNDLRRLVEENVGSWTQSNTEIGLAYDLYETASTEETRRAMDLVRDLNLSVITTHYLGGVFGASNSPLLLQMRNLLNTSVPIVFAHAAGLTPADALLIRTYNHSISIAIESEHQSGLDYPNSWQDDILPHASLGVDTHFTFSSDIVSQARLFLQATRLRLYRMVLERWQVPSNNPMSVNQAFLLATRNGGLSLWREDLGVIEEGAKADLVVFRGDSPGMLDWVDPVAAVILHSNVGDIQHVIVDGKFKKRDGRLVGVDWEAVSARFLQSARGIQEMWRKMPFPVLEGDYTFGPPGLTVYGRAEQVDVVRGEPNDGYGTNFF